MARAHLKKWYLIVSFLLSLYLVFVTVVGFTSASKTIKEPLENVAHYVLWFFIAELIVLFCAARDIRTSKPRRA